MVKRLRINFIELINEVLLYSAVSLIVLFLFQTLNFFAIYTKPVDLALFCFFFGVTMTIGQVIIVALIFPISNKMLLNALQKKQNFPISILLIPFVLKLFYGSLLLYGIPLIISSIVIESYWIASIFIVIIVSLSFVIDFIIKSKRRLNNAKQ